MENKMELGEYEKKYIECLDHGYNNTRFALMHKSYKGVDPTRDELIEYDNARKTGVNKFQTNPKKEDGYFYGYKANPQYLDRPALDVAEDAKSMAQGLLYKKKIIGGKIYYVQLQDNEKELFDIGIFNMPVYYNNKIIPPNTPSPKPENEVKPSGIYGQGSIDPVEPGFNYASYNMAVVDYGSSSNFITTTTTDANYVFTEVPEEEEGEDENDEFEGDLMEAEDEVLDAIDDWDGDMDEEELPWEKEEDDTNEGDLEKIK